jgi:hypothetical protein
MTPIDSEALAGLTAAVRSLLPPPTDPSVQLILLTTPGHVAPTGIGGFVGTNEDPRGEIRGRLLEATALVTVRANAVGPVDGAVTEVIRAFVGADRAALLERGILRVDLDGVGPQSVSGSESNQVVERSLTFKVLYEFLKRPEEDEHVILEIPIDLDST